MIKVLFFASLKEALDCAQLQLDNPGSVAALKQQLAQQSADWQRWLLSESTLVAVNQTMANDATALNDGDEVAFFPPVTGG